MSSALSKGKSDAHTADRPNTLALTQRASEGPMGRRKPVRRGAAMPVL